MKFLFYLLIGCVLFSGCITEYEAKGLNEVKNILVVEGIITEGETRITLSRSLNLTDKNLSSVYVDDATVSIECDDGTLLQAVKSPADQRIGRYVIYVDKLHFDRKYRLRIEVEEEDYNSDCLENKDGVLDCPKKQYAYFSDYMTPIITPEIDSVFWTKKGKGQMVNIHVATHSPDNKVLYYRWSYKEDWEIHSDNYSVDPFVYPYYCWSLNNSKDLLVGSAEKTVFGRLTDVIAEIHPSNRKLEVLYRINVRQNAISKRAYDYYTNIKKNTQKTSDIFAPIQSELRGNITCLTDPNRPVIGYVDISSTTQKTRYIPRLENAYEYSSRSYDCESVMEDSLLVWYDMIPDRYVPFEDSFDENLQPRLFYILRQCVDCTLFGKTEKPDDWPQ